MDFEELYEDIEDLDVIINFQEIIKVIEQPIPDAVWEAYDVGDVLLSVQEKLKAKKRYDLIADFFTVIQKNNTEIMDDIGFYLIRDLVCYYAFKGDFDSVASTFEWMINDPLSDFDIYVLAFKSLALYQQNELIMKAIKKNYFEVEQSDKLIGYALSEFDLNLYYLETQNVYLSYGKPFNVNELKKLLKPYGFILDEDPTYTYDTGFFDEFPALNELEKLFAKSMDECMMLLRNFFMKRMLEKGMQFNVSGLLFNLIRNYWQEFTINKKNPKWKGFFNLKFSTFDRYLAGISGSFMAENAAHMIAAVWGVVYVYEFLLDHGLITQEYFQKFMINYKRMKVEILVLYRNSLFEYNYVNTWPKPDCIAADERNADKCIFEKSFSSDGDNIKNWLAIIQQDIDPLEDYKAYFKAVVDEQ